MASGWVWLFCFSGSMLCGERKSGLLLNLSKSVTNQQEKRNIDTQSFGLSLLISFSLRKISFPLLSPFYITHLIFPSFTIQFTTMNAGELLANSLSPGTVGSLRPTAESWSILASARPSLSSAPQCSPFLAPSSLTRSSYA